LHAGGDPVPEPGGGLLAGEGEEPGDLTVAGELVAAAWAVGQVRLDGGGLVAFDGVEGVDAEELLNVEMTYSLHAFPIPISTSEARMRFSPTRMRLLTVPSGVPSTTATSR
jgi:hypothetical protein